MSDFNSMTLMAAGEMIAEMSTQTAFSSLTLGWGVDEFCGSGSVASKANEMVRFARSSMGGRSVPTVNGNCDLSRAMIEHAITASEQSKRNKPDVWLRLLAGLKMDGFTLVEEEVPDPMGRSSIFDDAPRVITQTVLRRMLPEDVPETDFREATSEIEASTWSARVWRRQGAFGSSDSELFARELVFRQRDDQRFLSGTAGQNCGVFWM